MVAIPPPNDFLNAITLFNQQQFYACHEVLEDDCWRPEKSPSLKQFYQGVLQIAVGYHHAQHNNAIGMRNLLAKGLNNLKPLIDAEPVACWGDWPQLIRQVEHHQCMAAQLAAQTPSAVIESIAFPIITRMNE